MGIPWTTNAQKVAPSAAVGVVVTPSATAWAYSSWVTAIASASTSYVLTGVTYTPAPGVAMFDIEVGVGPAGSESIIATVKGGGGFISTAENVECFGHIPTIIPIDNIPAGSRVAVRLRKSDTVTTTWDIKLTYLQKPIIGGDFTVTAQPLRVIPYGANLVALTASASAWANSSWVTVMASAAADLVIAGIVTHYGHVNDLEYDIGVGAASEEIVRTTVSMYRGANQGGPFVTQLQNPLNVVSAGSRVAMRVRHDVASANASNVGLYYYHLPL